MHTCIFVYRDMQKRMGLKGFGFFPNSECFSVPIKRTLLFWGSILVLPTFGHPLLSIRPFPTKRKSEEEALSSSHICNPI